MEAIFGIIYIDYAIEAVRVLVRTGRCEAGRWAVMIDDGRSVDGSIGRSNGDLNFPGGDLDRDPCRSPCPASSPPVGILSV